MDETQLRTGAEVQKIGEDTGSLGARAVLKVLPNLGEEEVLVISRATPIRLTM